MNCSCSRRPSSPQFPPNPGNLLLDRTLDTWGRAEPSGVLGDGLAGDSEALSYAAIEPAVREWGSQLPRGNLLIDFGNLHTRETVNLALMTVNTGKLSLLKNRDTLAALVQGIRKSMKMNQREFAQLFENPDDPRKPLSAMAISNWETGKDQPNHKALAKLAALTADADAKEVLLKEIGIGGFLSKTATVISAPVREIRLLRDAVAAGTPRAVDEKETEQLLAFPKSWFTPGGELYALHVSGDSMAPIVNDGYIVIVNTGQRDPKKLIERMVAAREGDGITIKWLRRDGDLYLLVPQHVSTRHPVRVMRPEGDFSIVGAVVKWIGEPPQIRK